MKSKFLAAWMLMLCILAASVPLHTQASKKTVSKKVTSLLDAGEDITSLGEFEATFYCPGHCCNGGYTGTALGTALKPGKTIAVDKSIIKLGSEVIIKYPNGKVARYRAEDTGGAIRGRRIDVCVASHAEANRMGRQKIQVYIVK